MPTDRTAGLQDEQYISVTTYRRDGRAVPTPVWFALDGGKILVWTGASTGKMKRIRNNPRVEVAPCTARGKPTGAAFAATARILPAADVGRTEGLLDRKYGLRKRLYDLGTRALRLIRRQPAVERAHLEISPD